MDTIHFTLQAVDSTQENTVAATGRMEMIKKEMATPVSEVGNRPIVVHRLAEGIQRIQEEIKGSNPDSGHPMTKTTSATKPPKP